MLKMVDLHLKSDMGCFTFHGYIDYKTIDKHYENYNE